MAAVDQRGDGGQADGSATENGDAVTGLDIGLVAGMHADGEGLGEGSHVKRQIIGDLVEAAAVRLCDQEHRGESTLGSAVADPAQFVIARLDDDSVADLGTHNTMPCPVDSAGDLVAQAHRGTSPSSHSAHFDVGKVAPADSAGGDAN
ncbi:MAG TPA: hypothetical protein VNC61_06085 [Acidimicrobiales bacterium]|nr:hypothetical protein [Acidimicrobiales bacterium]